MGLNSTADEKLPKERCRTKYIKPDTGWRLAELSECDSVKDAQAASDREVGVLLGD